MKTKFILSAIFFSASVVQADVYTSLLKRYEKQIKNQERQLGSLRGRLEEKEKDVIRWKSKAEDAKSAWTGASALLDQTRAKMKITRVKRERVRIEADAAQWKTAENVLIARSAESQSHALARDLYANELLKGPASAKGEGLADNERVLEGIAHLTVTSERLAEESQKLESSFRTEEMRLQTEEQARVEESGRLHQAQETQWLKWQEAQRRRTSLEDEISQMEQSAKALQVMLQEVRNHRNQARALHDNKPMNEAAVASLKGRLPWPAQGRVVQNFGRQFAGGSSQLVVSNGIKIDAGGNRIVRAVQEGKVIYASPFREYGQLVIVQHRNGLTSVYAGLAQTQVKEGQALAALDGLGTTGESGAFYFELRHEEQPINPLVYLAPVSNSALSSRRTYR